MAKYNKQSQMTKLRKENTCTFIRDKGLISLILKKKALKIENKKTKRLTEKQRMCTVYREKGKWPLDLKKCSTLLIIR